MVIPDTRTPTPPLPEPLAAEVHRLDDAFSGEIAVWAHDLRRGETYGFRAEESFYPASTIKLFILRELFRRVEEGTARLRDRVVMEKADIVAGSGVIRDLTPPLPLSLHDAATLMITVSDNTATNLLIGRLNTRTINSQTHQAGFGDTQLGGKLFKGRGLRSQTTPRDLGVLMTQIARGRAVSASASTQMLKILRREQYNTIVGRYLPTTDADDEKERDPWKVASKSGSINHLRHDVAFVEGQGLSYVVALLSRGGTDLSWTPDNEGHICLAHVARAVHDHVARA
ncbi:MAG TPA: serine hydrolase [Candidatus Dormibacteraeota bacterium]|jgi:beta-lactamase class A|nr:serine hydrolase [Candidatus Dormibacteraeota bacterium]